MNSLKLLKEVFWAIDPVNLTGTFMFHVQDDLNEKKANLEYEGKNRLGAFTLWSRGEISATVMNETMTETIFSYELANIVQSELPSYFLKWMEALKPDSAPQDFVRPWINHE